MKMIGLYGAHVFGWQSSEYAKQAVIWCVYCGVWIPIRMLAEAARKKAVEDSPKGFIARNQFSKQGDNRHVFIQAGTNWGKSSLAKEIIADHMEDCLAGEKSMVLMDNTNLIDEVVAKVNPTDQQIRDRFILIDVDETGSDDDIGCAPRLNMLNTSTNRANSHVAQTARASILEMTFGSLLQGNENTGPMQAMLAFAAKTLSKIDNPSPQDFIDLLRDPLAFIQGVQGLPKLVVGYWADQFKMGKTNPTAEALARRAYQMIGNPVIERLLCNPVETVNIADRLNQGAILLVATRSGAATSAGARHIGRFIMALLLRCAKSRNYLQKPKRTVAIIDEFSAYLTAGTDDSLIELLSESRKMGFSIVLINQEEHQLSPRMLSSIIANCEIIVAGGVSHRFAHSLQYPMGIKEIESGPNAGEPNVDLPRLPPRTFAACVKGREPIKIKSRPDALGQKFTKVRKKEQFTERLDHMNQIMRELYAHDPSIDDADVIPDSPIVGDYAFQDVRPI